ncbi:MAG: hypothetical protein JWP00_2148 [Chloroflexi bacterium]|jgi:hypothetical protein|nr:hypothetical protein [Chloroflexota bacterium]
MAHESDNTNNQQAAAQGHGLTSEEARKAGLGNENLQEGKDYVVEYGRVENAEGQFQTKSGGSQPATQPLNDNLNDDDVSQRMGFKE